MLELTVSSEKRKEERGFVESMQRRAYDFQGISGAREKKRKAIISTLNVERKASRLLRIMWDRQWVNDTGWELITQAGVWCWKTWNRLMSPGTITDDVVVLQFFHS